MSHGHASSFLVTVIVMALAGLGLHNWVSRAAPNKALETAQTAPGRRSTNASFHPVTIRRVSGPPKVATGLTNLQEQVIQVSCGSCHTTTAPNIESRSATDLDQFHQGLKYAHGNLTCLSCHNSTNYDTLRLADSRSIEFSDVLSLCSQCHGPQRRDYDIGLHGGMNGFWDLAKGGRTRNTCVNCHDPHAPAFPLVLPVFPPRDRISVPSRPPAKSPMP